MEDIEYEVNAFHRWSLEYIALEVCKYIDFYIAHTLLESYAGFITPTHFKMVQITNKIHFLSIASVLNWYFFMSY